MLSFTGTAQSTVNSIFLAAYTPISNQSAERNGSGAAAPSQNHTYSGHVI